MINHEIKENIATITLDNPRICNAFSDKLIKDFIKILEDIDKNEEVRIVILKASGQHFSSGADLNWLESMTQSPKDGNQKDALLLAILLNKLNALTKPTIALVQGNTFGGALGLLACCDFVIAEADAKFCFSEVKLGLIPATIAPYVIHCIGSSAARRYFISADSFDANMAVQIGLVHILCGKGQLATSAESLVKRLQKNGPKAMSAAKQLVQRIVPIPSELINQTAELLATIRTSPEGQEGIKAFLEKRDASWISKP